MPIGLRLQLLRTVYDHVDLPFVVSSVSIDRRPTVVDSIIFFGDVLHPKSIDVLCIPRTLFTND